MSRPDLQLVPSTGELVTLPPCPRCLDLRAEDAENLERENRRLMRRIKQLERDRDAEREVDPNRQVILGLIERWRTSTGHPRANANSADRFDLIKARLSEGYSVPDLELAIDGIGAHRYVVNGQRIRTGKPSQRHDSLGIALKGGENVERFANLGAQARKARAA